MVALGLVMAALPAQAQLTAIGSFTGTFQEDFESFQNYATDPNFYLASGTSTFGGAAVVSGAANAVYEPGVAGFGLGGYGDATVHGGVKGLGVDNSDVTSATFTFTNTISQFGGWFAHSDPGSNLVRMRLYDTGGNLIQGEQTLFVGSSAMAWFGFSSTVAIKSVQISGDFPVMDDLQADPSAPVPEPFTMGLAGLALAAAARRRLGKSA